MLMMANEAICKDLFDDDLRDAITRPVPDLRIAIKSAPGQAPTAPFRVR